MPFDVCFSAFHRDRPDHPDLCDLDHDQIRDLVVPFPLARSCNGGKALRDFSFSYYVLLLYVSLRAVYLAIVGVGFKKLLVRAYTAYLAVIHDDYLVSVGNR